MEFEMALPIQRKRLRPRSVKGPVLFNGCCPPLPDLLRTEVSQACPQASQSRVSCLLDRWPAHLGILLVPSAGILIVPSRQPKPCRGGLPQNSNRGGLLSSSSCHTCAKKDEEPS